MTSSALAVPLLTAILLAPATAQGVMVVEEKGNHSSAATQDPREARQDHHRELARMLRRIVRQEVRRALRDFHDGYRRGPQRARPAPRPPHHPEARGPGRRPFHRSEEVAPPREVRRVFRGDDGTRRRVFRIERDRDRSHDRNRDHGGHRMFTLEEMDRPGEQGSVEIEIDGIEEKIEGMIEKLPRHLMGLKGDFEIEDAEVRVLEGPELKELMKAIDGKESGLKELFETRVRVHRSKEHTSEPGRPALDELRTELKKLKDAESGIEALEGIEIETKDLEEIEGELLKLQGVDKIMLQVDERGRGPARIEVRGPEGVHRVLRLRRDGSGNWKKVEEEAEEPEKKKTKKVRVRRTRVIV